MTYQIYSQQQLHLKSIARLKQIYSEIGCTVEVSDKRCKDAWISAIVDYQASKVQKVANEQSLAQAELNNYITDQAQAIAPEELRIVEVSFYDHEYHAVDRLIASITYDDDHLTQRWLVMVNGKEVFRANTVMRCHRYICIHYKDGSLPVQEEAGVQGCRGAEAKNLQQLSPLPLRSSAPLPNYPFIHPLIIMQPTISIPRHWEYPRFGFDQRTQQGLILGLYYYPNGTELAEQFGDSWRYVLMPNKNSDEISYLQENQIQPLSPQELFTQITTEIDFYQRQISILQQQLSVLTGGFNLWETVITNPEELHNFFQYWQDNF